MHTHVHCTGLRVQRLVGAMKAEVAADAKTQARAEFEAEAKAKAEARPSGL